VTIELAFLLTPKSQIDKSVAILTQIIRYFYTFRTDDVTIYIDHDLNRTVSTRRATGDWRTDEAITTGHEISDLSAPINLE
jgi:hypothetical protein